ncbi:S-adenosyl-L-methionine-dependent methyltransferase [Thozetella sp. PMI_491]|nr:S-adenosyl-L-methionine-dependent methyltransferase [Thozetella sp. PMI_491]
MNVAASQKCVAAIKPLSAEQVFDAVGVAYEAAFEGHPEQAASLEWLVTELAASGTLRARVVDVGCGTGRPVCSVLAEAGHDVLGIDISGAMIAAARDRVPLASFEQLDLRAYNPVPGSLDAVTIYFSLIAGVTQQEIPAFFTKIYDFLRPGGLFVFATVPLPVDSAQISWMGKPVVVSSLSPEAAVDAVRQAGFIVEYEHLSKFMPRGAEAGICKAEDVWEETHLFIYARKPSSA